MKKFMFFLMFFASCSISFAAQFSMKDAPFRDFSDYVSSRIHKNIILGKGVDAEITFHSQTVHDKDLENFFNLVCESYGFEVFDHKKTLVVTLQGEIFSEAVVPVVTVDRAAETETKETIASDNVSFTQGRLFTLKNVSSASLFPAVSQIVGLSGSVVAIPGQQSFYVRSSDEGLDHLTALLSVLDVPKQRVLIEAVIFETSSKDYQEIGVTLRAFFDNLKVSSVSASALSSGGSLSYMRTDFSGLVSALETMDKVRMLSTPQILVDAGESGSVVVGQNVPFITGQSVGAAGDAENPFQTIERADVGVSLRVQPFVVSSELVDLVVVQSVSSITDDSFASDIILNNREIVSRLSVVPGQWVSLGGLISDDTFEGSTGVPVLKSLPYIGSLFRVDSTDKVKRQLSVLIRLSLV